MSLYKSKFSNKLSFFVGKLAHISVPVFFRKFIWTKIAKKLGINIEEALLPLPQYSTCNAFFTRELKPECRPINMEKNIIISPVDGTVLMFGDIQKGQLIQAKGIEYPLQDFCPIPGIHRLINGFFATFYLSPSDCHRIFSPISGNIILTAHVPGRLIPVREPYISNTPYLYIQNERAITVIDHEILGLVVLVYVGALNVGSIHLSYLPDFKTNISPSCFSVQTHDQRYFIQKSDHIATFSIGSTVVMMVENSHVLKHIRLSSNQKINYGREIVSF